MKNEIICYSHLQIYLEEIRLGMPKIALNLLEIL